MDAAQIEGISVVKGAAATALYGTRGANGVILITGQTEDMTGDYLALILNDGYVELR